MRRACACAAMAVLKEMSLGAGPRCCMPSRTAAAAAASPVAVYTFISAFSAMRVPLRNITATISGVTLSLTLTLTPSSMRSADAGWSGAGARRGLFVGGAAAVGRARHVPSRADLHIRGGRGAQQLRRGARRAAAKQLHIHVAVRHWVVLRAARRHWRPAPGVAAAAGSGMRPLLLQAVQPMSGSTAKAPAAVCSVPLLAALTRRARGCRERLLSLAGWPMTCARGGRQARAPRAPHLQRLPPDAERALGDAGRRAQLQQRAVHTARSARLPLVSNITHTAVLHRAASSSERLQVYFARTRTARPAGCPKLGRHCQRRDLCDTPRSW